VRITGRGRSISDPIPHQPDRLLPIPPVAPRHLTIATRGSHRRSAAPFDWPGTQQLCSGPSGYRARDYDRRHPEGGERPRHRTLTRQRSLPRRSAEPPHQPLRAERRKRRGGRTSGNVIFFYHGSPSTPDADHDAVRVARAGRENRCFAPPALLSAGPGDNLSIMHIFTVTTGDRRTDEEEVCAVRHNAGQSDGLR
jgi:hypothetical protein